MSKLENNTTSLLEILTAVNALPDASTGAAETWTFTLEDGSTVDKVVQVG